MISIGLAPLASAPKKLEAREPWKGKRGRFSAKHMDFGQTCRGAGESSAYVPARRTINGTKGRAEPARTIAITHSTRTSVQLCKYEPVASVAQR